MRRSFLSCDAARVLCVGALLLGVAAAPGFLRAESCFTLHDQKVVPGQVDVWFPVLLSNDQPIQGFQLMGAYDPNYLVLKSFELSNSILAGRKIPEVYITNDKVTYFEVGCIFEFEPPLDLENQYLPPGQNQTILNLVFDVSPAAPAGTKTRIDLVNDDSLSPVFNLITVEGFGVVLACLEGSTVEVAGGNPRLFLRGDADSNGVIDLSDAVRVLDHLFLGGNPPDCLDAADFHDRGEIDISAAIAVLSFLFLGGPPPEVPFPNAGLDPSEDGLECS